MSGIIETILGKKRMGKWAERLDLKHRGTVFEVQRRLFEGKPVGVILDVGANIGQAALTYAAGFPEARIYSFEPFPESYEKLVANTAEVGRVKAFNVALGEAAGNRTLHLTAFSDTNSLLAPEAGAAQWVRGKAFFDETGRHEVRVETLDGWVKAEGVEKAGILKVDVQGGEQMVLAGGEAFLTGHGAGLVVLEVNLAPLYVGQATMGGLMRAMEEWGYRLFDFYHVKRHGSGRVMWMDLLFFSPEWFGELRG